MSLEDKKITLWRYTDINGNTKTFSALEVVKLSDVQAEIQTLEQENKELRDDLRNSLIAFAKYMVEIDHDDSWLDEDESEEINKMVNEYLEHLNNKQLNEHSREKKKS
jgi:hypothetical protein